MDVIKVIWFGDTVVVGPVWQRAPPLAGRVAAREERSHILGAADGQSGDFHGE